MRPAPNNWSALIAAVLVAASARAQITTTYTYTAGGEHTEGTATVALLPKGEITQAARTLNSYLPLQCIEVCWRVQSIYATCFLNPRYADPGSNPNPPGTRTCDELCDEAEYNHLAQCANCIVANGGERAVESASSNSTSGASSNSGSGSGSGSGSASNTASASGAGASASSFSAAAPNVGPSPPRTPTSELGPVDAEQAAGWLRNVTERCAARGTTITGASLTATPTATGPYSTSWTRGDTPTYETWTELATIAQVVDDLEAELASAQVAELKAYYGDPTSSASVSASASASGQPSGQPDSAAGMLSPSWLGTGLGIVLGAVLVMGR